jgi:hypothetical protein
MSLCWSRALALSLAPLLFLSLPFPLPAQSPAAGGSEIFTYEAEWRLVRAGQVMVTLEGDRQAHLRLHTVGLVAQLFKVDDNYQVNYRPGYCAADSLMLAREGRRHRETRITFDPAARKATYLEKDLVKDTTVSAREIEIAECVHDVLGGLQRLRGAKLDLGQSTTLPLSDGKKFVNAKVEAQAKEVVKSPLGSFPSIRYEAFIFSGVLFGRKGRAFVWLTDDDRRIPVQMRIQLPFYIGTVTLRLEKQERP